MELEEINIRLTGSREFVDAFVDYVNQKESGGKLEITLISEVHERPRGTKWGSKR